jgi:hypothetical protein
MVYSANAAGVGAAVTAAAHGKFKVVVLEPLQMIGGMAAAGGVALMNQGGCGLTGLSRNWSMLCGEYYYGTPQLMTPVHAPFPSMNVSEMAFWKLLRSVDSITVKTGCRAVAVTKPSGSGSGIAPSCLSEVQYLCNGDTEALTIRASYMIDASHVEVFQILSGSPRYGLGALFSRATTRSISLPSAS